MGMTTPFPEPDSPELEPFIVYSRIEILSLLEALESQGVLVTAYFDRHAGFAVTALLAVNPRFGELVFDHAADASTRRRLLAAESITFVSFVDQIKLQFQTGPAEATTFDDRPAFRVQLPEQALRLQRRDSFRVKTLISRPAHLLLPVGDKEEQYEKLRLIDLSIGGVAVVFDARKRKVERGDVLAACFLDLPGVGSVGVTLKVRHVAPLPRDENALSVGCELVDLAPASRTSVQRYINWLDAEQRKLASRAA